jgi:hypothetical protein
MTGEANNGPQPHSTKNERQPITLPSVASIIGDGVETCPIESERSSIFNSEKLLPNLGQPPRNHFFSSHQVNNITLNPPILPNEFGSTPLVPQFNKNFSSILELSDRIQILQNSYDQVIPLLQSIDFAIKYSPFDNYKLSEHFILDNIPTTEMVNLIKISAQIKTLLQRALTLEVPKSSNIRNGVGYPISPICSALLDHGQSKASLNEEQSRKIVGIVKSGTRTRMEQERRLSNDATAFMDIMNDIHAKEGSLKSTPDTITKQIKPTNTPAATFNNNVPVPFNHSVAKPTRSISKPKLSKSHSSQPSPSPKPKSPIKKALTPKTKPVLKIKSKSVTPIKKATSDEKSCSQCGNSDTPEWRRGPKGPKTTCNACGLFYGKLLKKFDLQKADSIMALRTSEIGPNGEIDRRVP